MLWPAPTLFWFLLWLLMKMACAWAKGAAGMTGLCLMLARESLLWRRFLMTSFFLEGLCRWSLMTEWFMR